MQRKEDCTIVFTCYQQNIMPSRKRRNKNQKKSKRRPGRSIGRRTHLQRMINIDIQNSLQRTPTQRIQYRSPTRPVKMQRSISVRSKKGRHLDFSRSVTMEDLSNRLTSLDL